MRSFLALLLLCTLIAPLGAVAQMSTDTLTLSFSPTHPRPYDQVTVTVSSQTVNLSGSDLAISVDGAVIEEGARTATFRVGAPGSRTTVRASAVGVSGTVSVEKVLRPTDLSLIVEPDASAHPFYDGGLLIPSEGRLRIIALADMRTSSGARIANNDISYVWKAGDKELFADSGFGKSILSASAPPRYRDTKITVTATSRDGSLVADASVSITPVDPVLRIYETDPLSGTNFAKALLTPFGFAANEAGFRAVPYFFKSIPSFAWRLNGVASGVSDMITVRSSGGSGSAVLTNTASVGDASADAQVSLRFEGPRSGLFGL